MVSLMVAGLPGEAEGEAGYADFFARAEAMAAQNEDAAAIALYREAERFKGTPDSAKRLGKAYDKVGDPASATLYYRLALARAPEASDAPSLAQIVGTHLGKAGSEGKGLVEVFAPRASKISIQGREYPGAPVALFTAPGEYEVEAVFPSGKKTTRLRVKSGQVASLNFEPVQPPLLSTEQALPEGAVAKGLTSDEGPPANVLRIVSIIAMGVGVAAGGTGVYFGLGSANDAAQARNTALSRQQRQQFANEANAKAVPANALMIGGAAALVAGGVMFLVSLPEPGKKAVPVR
jgi:tetratricopeptide (TPR) repeat protein